MTVETYPTYPCKYEDKCGNFDFKKYCCTHGGGVGCASWRKLTDECICPNERLRNRVQGCNAE